MEGLAGEAERRRCRLTLAPRLPATSCAASPESCAMGGSRFSCLGSKSSGSEVDEEGILAQVALQALDGEVEEGWTPVTRRKKLEAETVADFWREIGFPTLASRFWEKSRQSGSSSGKSLLLCRSVDVYGAMEHAGLPAILPPPGSPSRGACSSPTGVHLARGPRMGSWRGPLPRWRSTPLPVLGQFINKAAASSILSPATSSAVSSGWEAGVQLGAVIAPMMALENDLAQSSFQTSVDGADCVHVEDLAHLFGLGHLVRRFRSLWTPKVRVVHD
jgi:hypothetical protein